MNRVIMSGRLTRDPEIRQTRGEKQTAVASFAIAVDRRFAKQTDEVKTDFFECTAWGKTAEHMEKYWKKGMKALVSGRLENETWTGKDGVKRTTAKIIVEEIEFCERKENSGEKKEAAETNWVPVPDGDDELPFKF